MNRLLDDNPKREQARQERLLIALERRFRRVVTAELSRASVEMLDGYGTTGSVPALPDAHEQRMKAIYADMVAVSIEAFGTRVLDQGKAAGLILESKGFAELFAQLSLDYIAGELIRRRIASVSRQTREIIVALVTSGQNDGLGVAEIARSIASAIVSISKQRGALIARTETHGAANFGADQAARATGLDLQKEWVSTEDARTRLAHSLADGQVVDMDQPFSVGGEAMMFPGDPNASAENIINCRCAVSHVLKQ